MGGGGGKDGGGGEEAGSGPARARFRLLSRGIKILVLMLTLFLMGTLIMSPTTRQALGLDEKDIEEWTHREGVIRRLANCDFGPQQTLRVSNVEDFLAQVMLVYDTYFGDINALYISKKIQDFLLHVVQFYNRRPEKYKQRIADDRQSVLDVANAARPLLANNDTNPRRAPAASPNSTRPATRPNNTRLPTNNTQVPAPKNTRGVVDPRALENVETRAEALMGLTQEELMNVIAITMIVTNRAYKTEIDHIETALRRDDDNFILDRDLWESFIDQYELLHWRPSDFYARRSPPPEGFEPLQFEEYIHTLFTVHRELTRDGGDLQQNTQRVIEFYSEPNPPRTDRTLQAYTAAIRRASGACR